MATQSTGPSWRGQDLSYITGKHLMYVYEKGWVSEIYLKDSSTMDYRVHAGIAAGRWFKDCAVNIVQLAGNHRYKINWTEINGNAISLCFDLAPNSLQHHGVGFCPQYVNQEPQKISVYQNDHHETAERHRDEGPTYPIHIIHEFAQFFHIDDAGLGDHDLIHEHPRDFASAMEKLTKADQLAMDETLAHFGQTWGSRDVSDLVGKRFSFAYQNGWHQELHVSSSTTIEHTINTSDGNVLYTTDAYEVFIVRVNGPSRYIVSWTDSLGTCVSINLDLDLNEIHGVHFLPSWILKDPEQPLILERPEPKLLAESKGSVTSLGPIYPLQVVSEFAQISV